MNRMIFAVTTSGFQRPLLFPAIDELSSGTAMLAATWLNTGCQASLYQCALCLEYPDD